MINLIPPETKRNYAYARRNKHLSKWLTALLIGIAGAALITAIGFIYLHELTASYSRQVSLSKQQLANQDLAKVDAQIKDMSNNLQLTLQVLSKQVLFSELLEKLGSRMPNETALSGLSVAQAQGAIDITAKAKSYAAATQIQVNLSAENNGLFSKVDLNNITCTGSGSAYPCTATLRALFASNNSFTFTSTSITGAKK